VKLRTNATQFSNPQPPPKELYVDVPSIASDVDSQPVSLRGSNSPTIVSSTFTVHRSVSPAPFLLSDKTLLRSTNLVSRKSHSADPQGAGNYAPPPPPFSGTFDAPPAIIAPPDDLLVQCSNSLLLEWMYVLQWAAEKNERHAFIGIIICLV
jgi:hypothetical protein